MSLEMCMTSLQQMQDLLWLTESTLKDLCCRRFANDEIYAKALSKVLGGQGKRGPASIFILFEDTSGQGGGGRGFHLQSGDLVEASQRFMLDPATLVALSHLRDEVLVSNSFDITIDLEEYQSNFPESIRAFVGGAIRNFVACRISGALTGALLAINYPNKATDYDGSVLVSLGVMLSSLGTLSMSVRETEQAFKYTIEALARACEAAEEDTGAHIVRVNRYAGALAANMGLALDLVEEISFAAQMHDVGKIKVPNSILLKAGPLSDGENTMIRMHPVYGQKILGDSPRLRIAREIAISHHENWDGSGYPYGLAGNEIPLVGRIVKLADVYDALRSRRSYKPPLTHREVLTIFREGDARVSPTLHFDPEVLATFFNIEQLFAHIYEGNQAYIPA